MTLGDRLVVGGVGLAALAALFGAWLLLFGASAVDGAPDGPAPEFVGSFGPTTPADAPGTALIVDVEGGVVRPGILELPAGSRVADALAAAGGYARDADLAAAATSINLAAELHDGQQLLVPTRGAAGQAAASESSGLINLNSASPEALDALPGIGPVTVQKIVAARQERPFQALDELVDRKVLTASQLDKIRDRVTVG